MESGDGGWIRAEADREPDSGEEPRLDEDDGWPATVAGPSVGSAAGRRWGRGGVPGFSAWVTAAAAVAAAAAGVAFGFVLIRGTPSASVFTGAAPDVSASPPVSVPARAGQLRVALTGRVLAVSGTSITIGGAGPPVTAAVTTGTRVTGRAHGVGGIKAGDQVAAQLAGTAAELTGTAAHLTALAIQDLAGA
jgi:hypothetical protein